VAERISQQEGILEGGFETAAAKTGGKTGTTELSTAAISKADAHEALIQKGYDEARAEAVRLADKGPNPGLKIGTSLTGDKPGSTVRVTKLASLVRSLKPEEAMSDGVLQAARGYLKEAGVIDDAGKVIKNKKLTVQEAEDIRIKINKGWTNEPTRGNAMIRELKGALDADVMKASGKDTFKEARQAIINMNKELDPPKASAHSTRKVSLVRDILEDKIGANEMVKKVANNAKYRDTDLNHLKTYLTTGTKEQIEQGTKAWDSLRADVIKELGDKAFGKGATDTAGNTALSKAALESAVNKIGKEKLAVLFSVKERQFINRMLDVGKLREPVRFMGGGLGPSGRAATLPRLVGSAAKLPGLGNVVSWFEEGAALRSVANNRKASGVETAISSARTKAYTTPLAGNIGAAAGHQPFEGPET
jgi:hypothetical protein